MLEPYISTTLVVVASPLLWPWISPYLSRDFSYLLFATVITRGLMILIPICSIGFVHRRSLAEAAGLEVGLIRLLLSLVFLSIPFLWSLLTQKGIMEIIVAPITEECFFRMYLFGIYMPKEADKEVSVFRLAYASFVSTFLFVIGHFVDMGDPYWLGKLLKFELFVRVSIPDALGLFIGAILFLLIYIFSGTILAAIAAHATWNASIAGCPVLEGNGLIIVVLELCLWLLLIREARDALKKEIARLRPRPKIPTE
jgi:membrane protease YdiL (CAAX protease family)